MHIPRLEPSCPKRVFYLYYLILNKNLFKLNIITIFVLK